MKRQTKLFSTNKFPPDFIWKRSNFITTSSQANFEFNYSTEAVEVDSFGMRKSQLIADKKEHSASCDNWPMMVIGVIKLMSLWGWLAMADD